MLSTIFDFFVGMFKQALGILTSSVMRFISEEIMPLVSEFGQAIVHFLALELGLMSYDSLA
jgi:hypothetical protein